MRRIVLFVMLIMGVVSADAQWKVTPEAGMNVTKYKGQAAKMGFKAGAAVSYTFESKWFSLQSGLYFVQRGRGQSSFSEVYGTQLNEEGIRESANIHIYPASGSFPGSWNFVGPGLPHGAYGDLYGSTCPHGLDLRGFEVEGVRMYRNSEHRGYIQLPVLARFNWEIGKDVRMHLAAGPYFAYGVTGKAYNEVVDWKQDDLIPATRKESWHPFGNERSYNLPRFDWGLGLEAGFEVKRLTFKLGYDLGLGKDHKHGDASPKYHTFSFTMGYTF